MNSNENAGCCQDKCEFWYDKIEIISELHPNDLERFIPRSFYNLATSFQVRASDGALSKYGWRSKIVIVCPQPVLLFMFSAIENQIPGKLVPSYIEVCRDMIVPTESEALERAKQFDQKTGVKRKPVKTLRNDPNYSNTIDYRTRGEFDSSRRERVYFISYTRPHKSIPEKWCHRVELRIKRSGNVKRILGVNKLSDLLTANPEGLFQSRLKQHGTINYARFGAFIEGKRWNKHFDDDEKIRLEELGQKFFWSNDLPIFTFIDLKSFLYQITKEISERPGPRTDLEERILRLKNKFTIFEKSP